MVQYRAIDCDTEERTCCSAGYFSEWTQACSASGVDSCSSEQCWNGSFCEDAGGGSECSCEHGTCSVPQVCDIGAGWYDDADVCECDDGYELDEFGECSTPKKECPSKSKPLTTQTCGYSGTSTRTVTCNTDTGVWVAGAWGGCVCPRGEVYMPKVDICSVHCYCGGMGAGWECPYYECKALCCPSGWNYDHTDDYCNGEEIADPNCRGENVLNMCVTFGYCK